MNGFKLGDPDLVGILNTLLLLAACMACGLAAYRGRPAVVLVAELTPELVRRKRWQYWFWVGMTVVLLMLALNKQLDLQTQFTAMLRGRARQEGWYAARRTYQIVFTAVASVGGVIAVGTLVFIVRRWPWVFSMAVLGLGVYAVFVMLRMVSLHHIDHLLGLSWHSVKVSRLVEPLGPGLILAAAWAQCSAAKMFNHAARPPANV